MPSRKRIAVVVGALACAFAAFVGVSRAVTPIVDLPSALPASSLPVASVDPQTVASVEAYVPQQVAQTVGISSTSFSHMRQLGVTALGALYIVPGTSGLCVVLLSSGASCGDPQTTPEKTIAIFGSDASGRLVGGGVLAADAGSVRISDGSGRKAVAQAVAGGFLISTSSGLRATHGVSLDVG